MRLSTPVIPEGASLSGISSKYHSSFRSSLALKGGFTLASKSAPSILSVTPKPPPEPSGARSKIPMTAIGVRRDKAALFQWVKAPPGELAPAGSNRSSHGGNEMAEAFG